MRKGTRLSEEVARVKFYANPSLTVNAKLIVISFFNRLHRRHERAKSGNMLDYDLSRRFDRLYSATCYQSEVRRIAEIDNRTIFEWSVLLSMTIIRTTRQVAVGSERSFSLQLSHRQLFRVSFTRGIAVSPLSLLLSEFFF